MRAVGLRVEPNECPPYRYPVTDSDGYDYDP